jgi:hypothetical protein
MIAKIITCESADEAGLAENYSLSAYRLHENNTICFTVSNTLLSTQLALFHLTRRRRMTFNPLQEKGIPLEKQLRNWSELSVRPYDKYQTDPYTKCRVVAMNGIEAEAILFSHQFARY